MEVFWICYWITGLIICVETGADVNAEKASGIIGAAFATAIISVLWLPLVLLFYFQGESVSHSEYGGKMRARRQSDFELYGC